MAPSSRTIRSVRGSNLSHNKHNETFVSRIHSKVLLYSKVNKDVIPAMSNHSTVPCMMKRSSLTPEYFLRSRTNATFVSTTNTSNVNLNLNNNNKSSPRQEWAPCKIQDEKLRCELRQELGMSSFANKEKVVYWTLPNQRRLSGSLWRGNMDANCGRCPTRKPPAFLTDMIDWSLSWPAIELISR